MIPLRSSEKHNGGNELWEVEGLHFSVGLGVVGGVVKHTAPLNSYMVGWDVEKVKAFCRRRKWRLRRISPAKS